MTSLVNDIIMSPIGKILGGVDFANLFVVLGAGEYPTLKAAKDAGAATINYGVFLNTLVNLLIIATVLFLVVRAMNRLKGPPPALTQKDCPHCAMAIPIAAKKCPHCASAL